MTIFKNKTSGRLYTITETKRGTCICGNCGGKFVATEYPRGLLSGEALQLDTLDDFEKVAEA